ncbi:cellulose biosynthesis protein BcsN [Devosia sp. YR412]|uniref:cellulose biosynthesis protein BcsN n=1 Tax=Devosia sp. YR412 TaxID=1881030 RepID=UPI00147D7D6A|nr:cellulose biosynthesis protein BcsN [Devosia sp. YR412]
MKTGARLTLVGPLLAVLLCACASTRDLPPQEARIVAPVDAMIIPPPGGPGIVNVVSTTFPNAIKQDISLATQARSVGENKISIIAFEGKGGDGSDAALRDIPFTAINLTEEALTAWPNSGMAVSPYYVQNDYGPFGYAIGRPPNGDTCIYAWQRIEPTLTPSGMVDRGTINVRLQLCQRGASEQALLEVMYRLRLNSSVHAPRPAPSAIGRTAVQIRPIGAEGFANVIDIPAPVTRSTTTTRPAAATVVPVAITPAPGAPIVPSPTGVTRGTSSVTVPRPPASSSSGSVVVPRPSSGAQ